MCQGASAKARSSEIVHRYLAAMAGSDLGGVLACFDKEGMVVSPVYGEQPARRFYEKLFADTISTGIRLRDLYVSEQRPEQVIAYFDYRWQRHGQATLNTRLIDFFNIDPVNGKIARLRIVMDDGPQ